MFITFPKIYQTLEFADYNPDLAGQSVRIWVNSPKQELLAKINQTEAQRPTPASDEDMFQALAFVWDGWSVDDVREFAQQCELMDPRLYLWALQTTFGIWAGYHNSPGYVEPGPDVLSAPVMDGNPTFDLCRRN